MLADDALSQSHVPLDRLHTGFRALAAAPLQKGELRLIVRRLVDGGGRDQPESAQLTEEEGLVGDAWSVRPPSDPNAQITVMREDVARLIANGQPLTRFGDNLLVDLDLSDANLPPGSRLRVGECVVVVTAEPHTGCRKFRDRFGKDALRFIASKEMRGHNVRGIHWRVVRPGAVSIGDSIEVLSRG